MPICTYILPIDRASYPVLNQLQHAGHLHPTPEPLSGTRGVGYALSTELPITAASDHRLNVGAAQLAVDLYRLPEWEYSTMVEASPDFKQHDLAHLMQPLLASQELFDAQSDAWSDAVVTALQMAPLTGPHALMVSEQWARTGRWLTDRTRLIRRGDHWELQLAFALQLHRDETVPSLVMGIDSGINPLITTALLGGGTHTTEGVAQLGQPTLQRLCSQAQAAGVPQNLARRAVRLLRYAASRQLIEKQILLPLKYGTRAVIVEDLRYTTFPPGFVVAARELALTDLLSAWLPQRLHAYGAQLIRVNPAYTSRDCSQDGCPGRQATRQSVTFRCPVCGYETGVHENAARNILSRGLSRLQ